MPVGVEASFGFGSGSATASFFSVFGEFDEAILAAGPGVVEIDTGCGATGMEDEGACGAVSGDAALVAFWSSVFLKAWM